MYLMSIEQSTIFYTHFPVNFQDLKEKRTPPCVFLNLEALLPNTFDQFYADFSLLTLFTKQNTPCVFCFI